MVNFLRRGHGEAGGEVTLGMLGLSMRLPSNAGDVLSHFWSREHFEEVQKWSKNH